MVKRILIYCLVLAAAYVLVAGYSWFRTRQSTERMRKEMDAMLADETTERDALATLGNLNLEPNHLTLAEIEDKLHQPGLRQSGTNSTTSFGWACGKDHCAIWASFLVPFGQEVPPTQPVTALIVNAPGFRPFRSMGVGGIYLGEPIEEMQNTCRKRGCVPLEKNRMRWNEDWNFVWANTGGKISWLVFQNEQAIRKAKATVGSEPPNLPKGPRAQ
jgi:hypothetical protein